MQDAIACFNKNEFSQAGKMFEKIKSQTRDDSELFIVLDYLLKIYKKINPKNVTTIQIQILENLYNLKKYKDFINFCNDEQLDFENLKFELKRCLLEVEYSEGNIEKVRELINRYCLYTVEEKVYNHAPSFFEWIEKNNLETLKTMFSKLLFMLETHNENEIILICNKIEEQLIFKWKKTQNKVKAKTQYFEHLINILENSSIKTYKIKEKILDLKVKAIAIGCTLKLTNKEKIEFVVLNSKDQFKLALLMSTVADQFIRISLKEIIIADGPINTREIGAYSTDLKKYFDKKSNVIVSKSNSPKKPVEINLEGLEEITDLELRNIYNYYNNDAIQKDDYSFEAMSIIKYDNEIDKEPYHLITTFIELELYDAAYLLAQNLDDSNSKIYIKARILFLNKKYLETITLINENINFNSVSEKDSIPYYYLKAESYKKMGKESEAQNIFSLISTFNPNFRSLKERLI